MKIIHLCLEDPYIEGWGYQQNILAKYHKKLGHEVVVIASKWYPKYKKYKVSDFEEVSEYQGIKIIRLDKGFNLFNKFISYKKLYNWLESEKPDIIFFHTIQSLSLLTVRKYKINHPKVLFYGDIHAEYNIAARTFLSKYILHKIIWRAVINRCVNQLDRIYCTKPRSIDFSMEMYKINNSKLKLLYMGGDPEFIIFEKKSAINLEIRKKYRISKNSKILITGGKLESNKRILEVIRSFKSIEGNFTLIVFGFPPGNEQTYYDKLLQESKHENIIFTGWLSQSEIYKFLLIADLGIFPGIHSVLWEQAVACHLPLIVRYWPGLDHVDIGGNVLFVYNDIQDELNQLVKLVTTNNIIEKMKYINQKKDNGSFLYNEIAKKSISLE